MNNGTRAGAFCPGHITGFFQICDQGQDELAKGSLGAGFSLAQGVTTSVGHQQRPGSSTTIHINGRQTTHAMVSVRVTELFYSAIDLTPPALEIRHTIPIPMGAGLGTSGAGALSLAYALNRLYDLPLSREQAARIAHRAEVQYKTGLGTVIAESVGGLEIRTEAGAPGTGRVLCIPHPAETAVCCLIFGPLSTQHALQDTETRKKINDLGAVLVKEFGDNPSVESFLRLSRRFAEHTGLITERVRSVLTALDAENIPCSMPMFGEGIFTLIHPRDKSRVLRVFTQYKNSGTIIESSIDTQGGRVINAA